MRIFAIAAAALLLCLQAAAQTIDYEQLPQTVFVGGQAQHVQGIA